MTQAAVVQDRRIARHKVRHHATVFRDVSHDAALGIAEKLVEAVSSGSGSPHAGGSDIDHTCRFSDNRDRIGRLTCKEALNRNLRKLNFAGNARSPKNALTNASTVG
ncbi:hypothetical protein [Mycobacterium avium]|uniref:hypothetical protein n=1 Tax=Mycobacterium avium TaxID=1764 RepID=UPI001131C3FC|nr:hypothetical protein [Mycobacterium avium]